MKTTPSNQHQFLFDCDQCSDSEITLMARSYRNQYAGAVVTELFSILLRKIRAAAASTQQSGSASAH